MSVLITAASHSEAYKLERLLQLPDVIFADFQELPHLTYTGRKFVKIPKGDSASFAHEMLNLALNSGIEKIFPLYADEILPLAESRQLFAEYGISIFVPSVLWLKKQEEIPPMDNPSLVVFENGKVIAGGLPADVILPEEDLTGIFYIEPTNRDPVFKLFTA